MIIHRPKPGTNRQNDVRIWAFVPSRSRIDLRHTVVFIRTKTDNVRRWLCDCEDFLFRDAALRKHCKHIKAVKAAAGL